MIAARFCVLRAFTVLAFASALFGQAWAEAFRIALWHETIHWNADASFKVEESIQVVFTEDRHGLIRKIPLVLDNGKGFGRAIFVSEVEVTDETGVRVQEWVLDADPDPLPRGAYLAAARAGLTGSGWGADVRGEAGLRAHALGE